MERPAAARSVVREARRRTHRPLTAKIRLGARLDEPALRDFVRLLEDEGVDLVAVHARLRDEPYGRKPRWSWVGKVKSWVSIPVVGNGGIFTGGDAVRCLHSAGCDGLMVGRGAAVRPWCPAEVAREAFFAAWTAESVDRPSVYRRFVQLLEEGFSPERRLGRLKEFTHYFSRSYAFGHGLASAVQASGSVAEAAERAEAFFARNEDPGP